MEEEALRNYCTLMIARVRNKQQQTDSADVGRRRHKHEEEEGRETERTKPERQVRARDECNLPLGDRIDWGSGQNSLGVTCQGLEVQPVPVQLLLMLRLKLFTENIKRAAEVKLHDPSVCVVCLQENASLALKGFIRRKKTQLQFQALKGRLNTLDP